MKKYLLASTLIAASAAFAVPAFATGSGTSTDPLSGSITNLNPDDYTETAGSPIYINGITGGYWAKGESDALTISANIDISGDGMTLNDGYSDTVYTFTGNITGNGNWVHTTSQSQKYIFTGSLAGYSGNITDTGQSGTKATYIHYGNGGQAATDTNVSGTGSVTVNGNITFNYGGYATSTGDTAQAITIGNSSLTGTSVEFTGSVNYEVSSALAGYNSSSTLTISNANYTTTITGSISNFASVTVASGSTLAFSGSASIGSAITNSGTVVLDTNVTFVLDNMDFSGDWSDGATYTLITGTGTIKIGDTTLENAGTVDSLGTGNVSSLGTITSAVFTYDSGTLTVTVTGEYVVEGLNGTGGQGSPYFTAGTGTISIPVSGNSNIFTGTETTVYLATDTRSLGSAEENVYWSGSFTAACDIVIGDAGVYITNGGSSETHTFTGKISGSGSMTIGYYSQGQIDVTQHYIFTGDLSGWSGDFSIITTANNTTNFNYVYYGNNTNAATNTSVSGTGKITVDFGIVQYNYTGYASGEEGGTLTVTNSSIEAHTIEFAGSVNYEVSADLIGWDGTGYDRDGGEITVTNSTLSITTTGTVTLTGMVSGFDIISVASGALNMCLAQDTSISNVSGAGNFEKSGETTLAIEGYAVSGTTTVSGGTLVLTGETILGGSAEIHVTEGATLDLQGVTKTQTEQATKLDILYIEGGTVKVNNLASGWGGQTTNFGSAMYNGMLQISNGGILEVTEVQATDTAGRRAFAVTSGEGTYRYSGEETSYITAEGNRHIHLGGTESEEGATLIFEVVNSGATLDVSMVISYGLDTTSDSTGSTSTGALKKTGAGTLILSGTNLYLGGTTVSEGTLVVQNASALGSGDVSVSSNATLQLDVALTTSGDVTFASGAKLVLGDDILASLAITDYAAADEGAVAIITASNITFGSTSVDDADDLSALVNKYVSAGGYTLSWTWEDGTLYAIVAAPEPSMFGLFFGLGAIGLVATRRRRR